MHYLANAQYWTGLLVFIQDYFFCHLAGQSAPTGLAIVYWVGCIINTKILILKFKRCLFVKRRQVKVRNF